jgi:ketosteroid isomerase-like protein
VVLQECLSRDLTEDKMRGIVQRQVYLTNAAVRRHAITSVLVTAILLGCQPQAPTFTEAEKAAVEAEIRAARDAFFDAATSLDAEAMYAFLDEDFIHVSNEQIAPMTQAAAAEAWEPLSHIELNIKHDRVVALSNDVGFTLRTASYVVFDAAGVVVESNDWAGTHIWARSAEGWKVHAAHEGRPTRD